MQFERIENTSRPTVQVVLDTLSEMRTGVIGTFYDSFHRLGGISQGTANSWIFPKYITSEVIQEIIHNTCFVCGGLMQNGEQLESFPPKQIRRCTSCGHNHT